MPDRASRRFFTAAILRPNNGTKYCEVSQKICSATACRYMIFWLCNFLKSTNSTDDLGKLPGKFYQAFFRDDDDDEDGDDGMLGIYTQLPNSFSKYGYGLEDAVIQKEINLHSTIHCTALCKGQEIRESIADTVASSCASVSAVKSGFWSLYL